MRYFAYDYMHSVNPGHYTGPSRLLKFLTAENQEYVNDNTTVRTVISDVYVLTHRQTVTNGCLHTHMHARPTLTHRHIQPDTHVT